MGNHIVGEMYHVASVAIQDRIPELSKQEATEILDRISVAIKKCYHYSSDAEFDDYDSPGYPLWDLLVKVFAGDVYDKFLPPKKEVLTEDDYDYIDLMNDSIISQFKEKYGFN